MKRPFKLPTYKTFDPEVNGYGSEAEWRSSFKDRMGIDAARAAVGSDSPHGILGVLKSATWDEIKKAYRKLVMQHHPDRGGDPAAFRKVQGAYEILEHVYATNR